MQIPYTYYDFSLPPTISEIDYRNLRRTLQLDPTVKLIKEESFYAKFKWGILAVIISTSLTIILMVIRRFQWNNPLGGKLNSILTIAGFVCFFTIVGVFGLGGGASFLWYIFERNPYYRWMKRELVRTENYQIFLTSFYRRHYGKHYPFV